MKSSDADREPVEILAEEFLARRRQGERVSIAEYLDRYPDWADEIQDVFPALELMAEADPGTQEVSTSAVDTVTERTLPPPKRLGDYRILREIGRGAMGVVYEAEQESLGRRVALKVLPSSVANDAKALARFQSEARAAARLHHTNIVPVFEVGQDDDTAYYAMQFIQGQSLDQVILELRRMWRNVEDDEHGDASNEAARLSAVSLYQGAPTAATQSLSSSASHSNDSDARAEIDESPTPNGEQLPAVSLSNEELSIATARRDVFYRSVAQIGEQVAAALSYAHDRGIIHRDIKPSNLLMDTNGTVWVADFGLAKFEDDGHTRTGDIVGTLRYMSPERFKGLCNAQSDTYALGLTLFELLLLQPAFDSADQLELVDLISNTDPQQPRSVDPRIPRDLETIVLKAIEKDPTRRYQSAEEMAEDLRHFLADEPIHARRISRIERAGRWVRKNRAVAALGAAIMLLLALVAIVADGLRRDAIQNWRQERERSYVYGISAAFLAWHDGDKEALKRLLKELVPEEGEEDIRGFEYFYLCELVARASQGEKHLFDEPVSDVSVVHGGKTFAVSLEDESLFLVRPGEKQRELFLGPRDARHKYRASGPVAYLDQGQLLAVATHTGDKLSQPVKNLVRVFDLGSDQQIAEIEHAGRIMDISVAADGLTAATVDAAGDVKIWNGRTGETRFHAELPPFTSNYGRRRIALSEDGDRLAVGSAIRMRIWDLQDPEVPIEWDMKSFIRDVCFSPDGRVLAVGTYNDLSLLDTSHPTQPTLRKFSNTAHSVAFTRDGNTLVIGDLMGRGEIWTLDRPDSPSQFFHSSPQVVHCLALAPDAGMLVSACGKEVKIWEVQKMKHHTAIAGDVAGQIALAASPHGDRIATGCEGFGVKVWNPASKEEFILQGHAGHVLCVGFTHDGEWLVSASADSVWLWDLRRRAGEELKGVPQGVRAVAFSRDDKLIGFATEGGTVGLWDIGKRALRYQFKSEVAVGTRACVAFSPDGELLAVGGGRGVELWRLTTKHGPATFVKRFLKGAAIRVVRFSPNGRYLASSGSSSVTHIWDLETESEVYCAPATGPVSALAFSPDGQTIAIQSARVVLLVHFGTGHTLGRIHSGDLLENVVFLDLPEGPALVTGSEVGPVVLMRAPKDVDGTQLLTE